MEDEEANVNLALLCNKDGLNSSRISLTEDEKYVICACGKNVLLYSSLNSNIYRQFTEHKAKVTHFSVSKDGKTITSASIDGNILIWFYQNLEIKESYHLGFAIYYIKHRQSRKQYLICHPAEKESQYTISLLKVNEENEPNGYSLSSLVPSSTNLQMIASDKMGNYVAVIFRNSLRIRHVAADRAFKYNYQSAIFTCVAFHPFDAVAATGDVAGKIIIWRNITVSSRPILTELHWHSNPVNSMCFTSEGTSLLSGGAEAVLVLWQLDTLKPDFKPRLGAKITDIQSSSKDRQVAIALENNAIALIRLSTFTLTGSIRKLAKATYPALGMHHCPRTNCLVLNSEPAGQLQFYYPDKDNVSAMLNVTGQNYVSDEVDKNSVCSEIEHLSFNFNGLLLATVQRQKSDFLPEESILKFWAYDKVKKMYTVESIVDPPHKKRVTSLEFSSQPCEMVVTTSQDGVFKLWTRHQKERDSHTWQCSSVCYYGSEPCTFARFSFDSSLIAAAYGELQATCNFIKQLFNVQKNFYGPNIVKQLLNSQIKHLVIQLQSEIQSSVVTIWETDKHQLRTTFHNPVPREAIKLMTFGKHDSAPYLVTATAHFITVWNLLTCGIWWSAEAQLTCLVADPFSSSLAAFLCTPEGDSTLYLFDPATPKSCKVYENVIKQTKVKSAAFLRKRPNQNETNGMLYAYTSEQGVYKVCPDGVESSPEESLINDNFNKAQSDYEKIFGLARAQQTNKEKDNSSRPIQSSKTSGILNEMLETPAHVLPPVKTLCEMFLIAMQSKDDASTKLNKKYFSRSNRDSDVEMENDEESSSDEDLPRQHKDHAEVPHMEETVSNEKQFLDQYDFTWMS